MKSASAIDLKKQQFQSTKERPGLNPVLSALINEDVKKSIDAKRHAEYDFSPLPEASAVAQQTTAAPVQTTVKYIPKARDDSVVMDSIAGSSSEKKQVFHIIEKITRKKKTQNFVSVTLVLITLNKQTNKQRCPVPIAENILILCKNHLIFRRQELKSKKDQMVSTTSMSMCTITMMMMIIRTVRNQQSLPMINRLGARMAVKIDMTKSARHQNQTLIAMNCQHRAAKDVNQFQ